MATVTPAYLSLEVNLSVWIEDDEEARNLNNYIITPVDADAVTAKVVSISNLYNEGFNGSWTIVVFDTSDMTDGKEYNFTVVDNKITRHSGGFLNGVSVNFFAVSQLPIISSLTALSDDEIEVVFSKDMSDMNLDDTTVYNFDKGLRILEVTIVSPRVIRLRTTKQTASEIYTLTIL